MGKFRRTGGGEVSALGSGIYRDNEKGKVIK